MKKTSPFSGARFRRAIRAFVFGRSAQALGTFFLTLLVIRVLNPTDYGAYMTLWGMVELIVPLSSMGLLQAVQRYLPELASRGEPGNLKAFVRGVSIVRFTVLVMFSALLAWQWPALSGWLGFAVSQQEDSLIAVMLVVTVLGQRFVAEMLESVLEQGYAQIVRALDPLGRLFGVVVLMSMGQVSLGTVLWVDLAVSAAGLLLAEFFLARQLSRLKPAGDYRVTVGEVTEFAWHMFGWQWLNAAGGIGVLRVIIARTLGLEAAGQFAFLQQLTLIVGRYVPGTLLANVIRPMLISRHAAGQTQVVATGLGMLLKGNFLLLAGGVALLAAGGDVLIAAASGGRVQGAGLIMLLMLIGLVAAAQGQVLAMAMQINRYTRTLRNFSLIALAMPLLVWVGTHWGLLGVAAAMIVELWVRNGLILMWLQRQEFPIEMDWTGYRHTLTVVTLLAVLGFLVSEALEGRAGYAWLAMSLSALFYVLGLRMVRPISHAEFVLMEKVAGRRVMWISPWVKTP